MSWVKDIFDPDERRWEEIYRNRFQTDKVVRSTHGVNCTGGCSWNIHVKNGVVALETQATDYPRISCDVPAYEPRGCQRGISASWYLYSPLRVKYPYLRGVLMDLWREARKRPAAGRNRIAVIYAEGEIVDGDNKAEVGGDVLARLLRRARRRGRQG